MVGDRRPEDDLDAVRAVIAALEPFDTADRDRILRWASEKLGVAAPAPSLPSAVSPVQASAVAQPLPRRDLRSFINEKDPGSDAQFAAAVAYFYSFEAQESERKTTIGSQDLIEACRLANRTRLTNPNSTLNNALRDGYLDRVEPGAFRINTVGENLVAMALPASGGRGVAARPGTTRANRVKKAGSKKAITTKATLSKATGQRRTGRKSATAKAAPSIRAGRKAGARKRTS